MTGRKAAYNSTLAIGGVSSPLDSFVVAESSVLRTNFCAEKPAHRQSAKRYRKPYDDSANIKLTNFERRLFEIYGQQTTPLLTPTAQKKIKKNANAQKNSIAIAHCTHLPLPANTRANPKAKSKECNRQRFILQQS
jgi:hypothetical protein